VFIWHLSAVHFSVHINCYRCCPPSTPLNVTSQCGSHFCFLFLFFATKWLHFSGFYHLNSICNWRLSLSETSGRLGEVTVSSQVD
jgi:hypothetical protein